MNTDSSDPHESPSPDIQTDDIQVGTKRVPNKRVCAFLIDVFIINLAYSVLTAVIAGVPDISFSLVSIAYLLVRDALIRGQSIGKYAVGLRVVDMEGQPCDIRRSVIRNLIFIVPVLIFGIVSLLPEPVESAPGVPDIPPGIGPNDDAARSRTRPAMSASDAIPCWLTIPSPGCPAAPQVPVASHR